MPIFGSPSLSLRLSTLLMSLMPVAGCAIAEDAGVHTVDRSGTRTSLAREATNGEGIWYEPHLTRRPCWNPFLVVEGTDGRSADVYADTRCR